jgi:hypothetical protein
MIYAAFFLSGVAFFPIVLGSVALRVVSRAGR